MANITGSDQPPGWEKIWRSQNIPRRYQTAAPPTEYVVEWADSLAPGEHVLDIGCGVGRHCIYLGERGFRVAGVDLSPSGIEISRQACAERQIPFDGRVADMNALPWDDMTFDAALSISTMHHHLRADIVETLGEVWRVLKPGGLLLVDFPSTDTLEYQQYLRQVAEGLVTEVEPNTFVDERPDLDDMDDAFMPHHYCDEGDLRDLLRSYEVIRLWPALRDSRDGTGKVGKWVAWARRPFSG